MSTYCKCGYQYDITRLHHIKRIAEQKDEQVRVTLADMVARCAESITAGPDGDIETERLIAATAAHDAAKAEADDAKTLYARCHEWAREHGFPTD